jgi:four helix bundle protein
MADNRHNTTKNEELERRMLLFAVSVIKKLEQARGLSPRIADQLTRASSSIGANYAEANNASSKMDFRNKVFIAKKEAAETRYWIDLVIELSNDETWTSNRQEAHELLMILQAIINTLKENSIK